MRLRNVMGKYRAVYKTLAGGKFYGHLLTPPKLDNPNRMEQPRLFLEVSPGVTNVSAGTVIVMHGKNYLVCDNADEDRGELNAVSYKLIRLDRQLAWSRQQAVVDQVSGLTRSFEEAPSLGNIWCAVEYDRTVNDDLKIESERFIIFTNAALQVHDKVGSYTVTDVESVLGVTQARVK